MLAPRPSLPEQYNARARREGWCTVCDPSLAFESPALAEIVAVWQTVRAGRPLPARTDFSARALARHLKNIAFIERVQLPTGPRRYRFGFFGSGLARWCGDRTGSFIDEAIPPPYTESWHAGYDMLAQYRAPLRYVSTLRSLKLEYLSTESAVLPLADAQGEATVFLLSAAFTPQVG
jgi:hypothetical protein